MPTIFQFVDSISATPTLRLDLNLAPWRALASTDFGFPEMRRAAASTLLTEGDQITASAYGNRILTLRLQVTTTTVDDTATQLQKLIQELNRPTNLLKTQLGTVPMFFRTFRSSPESWEIITTGATINITAPVLAEPFAFGLREDPVVLQTLNTDPAGGSNQCFLDVTGVKGDVEAPAYIRWPGNISSTETLFAVRRRGTPSATPFLFQAEAMTQGTNTTTQVNDANFSGAGNNYSRCTFGTATMADRLSINDLGTASVDLRGRYRVFLRYRKNTAGDAINLQLRWEDFSGGMQINNTAYATPANTVIQAADLGDIDIPAGIDPVTDPTGAELSVSDQFVLKLRAERTSGTGTIDFDFLLLVPADDRLAIAKIGDASTVDRWIFEERDGSAAIHAEDSSGRVIAAPMVPLTGPPPLLTPNQTNRIYILRQMQASGSWTLTTVANVSISYWPRYLAMRPVST